MLYFNFLIISHVHFLQKTIHSYVFIIWVSVHDTVRFHVATEVHMGVVEIGLKLCLCGGRDSVIESEKENGFHKRNLKFKMSR